MEFKSGDRVQIKSESTERPPRTGVVEKIVHGRLTLAIASTGTTGTSIYTRAAGALKPAEPRKGVGAPLTFLTSVGVEREFPWPEGDVEQVGRGRRLAVAASLLWRRDRRQRHKSLHISASDRPAVRQMRRGRPR